jgi:hypothetical protein
MKGFQNFVSTYSLLLFGSGDFGNLFVDFSYLSLCLQKMSGRRMGRSLENRRTGGASKQVPTILSRKRKSDEEDPSQPVRKNYVFLKTPRKLAGCL